MRLEGLKGLPDDFGSFADRELKRVKTADLVL